MGQLLGEFPKNPSETVKVRQALLPYDTVRETSVSERTTKNRESRYAPILPDNKM